MTRKLCCLIAVLVPATLAALQDVPRPNFSGEWKLNRERTRLQISMPDSTVFKIDHQEPSFKLSRTHVLNGKSDTFAIALTTDGKEVVTELPGEKIYSRLTWEGEKLVFDSRIVRGDREATNVVRYSLSADGRVFTAEEAFRGPKLRYDNVWVFDRVDATVK